ncbi:hypothetical protein UlMin_007835 [Ulmus minor]
MLQWQVSTPLLHPFSFITLTLIFLFFFYKFSPFSTSSKKNLPPSPPKLPIIGNLHQLGSHPHRSLQALSKHHGPLMLLHFGSVPVLIVSSADAAREIMKENDITFSNRPKSIPFEKLLYNYKDISMAPYGEYWRQMKSLSVMHLLSNKRVHSFRAVREEETKLMVEKIEQFNSEAINLSELFISLTNDVVCRVALGRKYSGKNFKELLGKWQRLLGGFYIGDFVPWLSWLSHLNGLNARMEVAAKEFDEFLEGVIEEHLDHQSDHVNDIEDHKNFVDILLWIQRENLLGFPIDRDSLKAIILNMFAAGTDTTFTVLEWAMTELLRHPKVMKKLQNEVRTIMGKKTDITEDDLEKMQYLKQVLKETLRLHPPIPLLIPRLATKDTKIKGYDIPAKFRVFINAFCIGRDPNSWDKADEFEPERFLNSDIDFKGHNFELIPFGAGRRGCPGINFAVSVIETCLATVVHKFDWELDGEAREKGLDVDEATGLSIQRKFPLMALAKPYHSPT